MKVNLAYGHSHLPVEFPDARTTVIQPAHNPGLADEKSALLAALENPIGAKPLREWLTPVATTTRASACSRSVFACHRWQRM